jgi:uncharacterized protein with FMN-binding domain
MRRTIAAVISTVAGLVLLLSFKSHTGSAGAGVVATAPHTTAPKATATPTPKPSAPTTTKKATATTRTVTGDTVDTNYGPVQVRVTLKGSTITDVAAIQLPQDKQRDIEIDNFAVPQLRQEALDAQSAQINSISGATYTSEGYIRSLQSALDSAGV